MSVNSAKLRQRLLAETGAEERRLELVGCETAAIEVGTGPLLVLVHGGVECGGIYWAPVLARLGDRFRVIAPDVPGLGESAPMVRLDTDSFSRWFSAFLDNVAGEEPPTVLAHSLTGSLVARFAAAEAQIKELVLCGVPGLGPMRMAPGMVLSAMRFGVRPTERNLERFLPWPFLDPAATRARNPEWFAAFISYMADRGSKGQVKRTMRQLTKAGKKQIPDDELKQIEVPTRLLWGERDRMTPLSLGQGATERVGWPLRSIATAGHVPHIERPEEFVAALVD